MFRHDPLAAKNPEQAEAVESTNRQRLSGWFDLLGVEPHFPLTTDETIQLLRRVEYDCDADLAVQYVSTNTIPPVATENGRMTWSATSVVSFAAALECRRRWLPGSIHQHKLTAAERIVQLYSAEG